MLGTQIPSIQSFDASNFHIRYWNLKRQPKNYHLKVLHMMSRVKVGFLTTYDILLAKFGELPMELYALKIIMDFQQRAHLVS